MNVKTKKLALLAVGIALFVVLSLCLQVPVFENYYLCLGYVVMAVYCWSFGTLAGTVVGFFGVILYCVVISGMRGMPGWALGNVVIGLALGFCFSESRGMKSRWLRLLLCVPVIVLACAAGILGVKSLTEHLLYAQPFAVRAAKNVSAFVADAAMLILSLPICELLDKQARKIFPELVRKQNDR
ncbi:MAG: ECF transporter S component [Oscillospiraceae bacterium]|nr:ECF transporter S component [Oscillospiraceae bacterium]